MKDTKTMKCTKKVSAGIINPFSTNVQLLYPVKTSENWSFFCFQGGIEVEDLLKMC